MKFPLRKVVITNFICIHGCVLCFTVPKTFVNNNHVNQIFSPRYGVRSLKSVNANTDNDFIVAIGVPSTESTLKALNINTTVEVLSTDPLIYIIPSLLSSNECDLYRHYVSDLSNVHNDRKMTRSNPPQVSLDVKKLWPLPFLSLLSGILPLYRLLESSSDDIVLLDIAWAVFPNVLVSLLAMGFLGFIIILPLIRRLSDISSRTSDAIALNMDEDVGLIGPLVDRATASVWTGHLNRSFSRINWEAPVVTRYDVGSIFGRHGDASPTRGSEWKDVGGQRLVTCICYLNTLSEGEGGETYFDKLRLKVRPQQGSALFFYPSNAATMEADVRTTHESLPPTEEKWIVQLFGRAERVPPPLGLPF